MFQSTIGFLDSATIKMMNLVIQIVELLKDVASDERGEGPVSAAIVVMIMAFLGVALWVAFKAIMHQATTTVSTQVSQLGQ